MKQGREAYRKRVFKAALCGAIIVAVLTYLHFPMTTDATTAHSEAAGKYLAFYDDAYAAPGEVSSRQDIQSYEVGVASPEANREDPHLPAIRAFVSEYNLYDKRVLEVGAGTGALQDVVADYTGLDISSTARRFFHKPFVQASATKMPFPENSFDVIWSIATLEHIPKPEAALREMRRVLRHNGLLYLAPAWQCRPWAAQGYTVRPWSDFGLYGKLVKLSIPVRDSVVFRSLYVLPIRVLRYAMTAVSSGPTTFRYNELTPNYAHYWTSDSDAVNSMDGFEVILWFTSRGDRCLNYPTLIKQLLFRNGPLIIQIRKKNEHHE